MGKRNRHDPDVSDNAADEKAVKDKAQKQRNAQEQFYSDIREVLDLPAGRRVLWRILSYCGIHKLSMTGNSETFFNEGRRVVGLWLQAKTVSADEKGYLAMQMENMDDLKNQP